MCLDLGVLEGEAYLQRCCDTRRRKGETTG
jgi:hypothetical protein